jgi:nitroreductase
MPTDPMPASDRAKPARGPERSDMSDPAEILRPLRRTRQYRQFEPTPLTEPELAAIADVARWTGSSQNTQPWRFIVVTQPSTLRALNRAGLPQTRGLETAPAAIAIVLPSDPSRAVHDAYDDGRVAERILIAASLLGLGAGISWIRNDVRQAAAEILGLPADRMVRTIVQLGHPTEAARAPKSAPGRARLPFEELVVRDRWPAR